MVTSASGIRALIRRSISCASIAMGAVSLGFGSGAPALQGPALWGAVPWTPAPHIGGKPGFERFAQLCHQNGAITLQRQCIAAGGAEPADRNPRGPGADDDFLGARGRCGQ